jgi:magnesium chelatase family protein
LRGFVILKPLIYALSGKRKEVLMVSICYSAAVSGINGILVSVEVDIRNGLPCFQMVGGVAGEVKEAKERVKIALENAGFLLPPKHITVNMSPAEVRKEGTAFDLPMAVALLSAFGYISDKKLDRYLIVGELSLEGKVRKINGLMPLVFVAKEHGLSLICPKDNLEDLGWSEGVPVYGINDVEELADIMEDSNADLKFSPISDIDPYKEEPICDDPFNGIYGNETALKALITAAAGGHSIFFCGNAENEKKKLAEAFMKLLPALSKEEKIEILKINSVLGGKNLSPTGRGLLTADPGRSPDIMDLFAAHKGLLFIEEPNLCKNQALSMIKDCAKNRSFKVGSGDRSRTYPCSFNMIISGKLCPCGHYPNTSKCACTKKQVIKHISSIDRFFTSSPDLLVYVSEPGVMSMGKKPHFENVAEKIKRARDRQQERFSGKDKDNAHMSDAETEKYCVLSEDAKAKLRDLLDDDCTVSDYLRLLRVARTVSDLRDEDEISAESLKESAGILRKGSSLE